MNRHVANGVEAVDKGKGFFAEAAKEWLAAHDQDGLLWREIDHQIGRGHDYARRFVESWSRDAATPFGTDNWEHRKQQIATTTPVKQADRVKMAEKLLEDPKVVKAVLAKPTVAARGVANAVIAKETAAKKKRAEQDTEYNERRKESLPGLTGRASKIITKIDQWAIELDTIRESLWELDGRTAELVDMAHENLIRAAEANRKELGRPSKLRVIEGSGTRTG